MNRNRWIGALLLGAMALSVPACSQAPANPAAATSHAGAQSLPNALDQTAGLQTVAEGLKQTRLKTLFVGTGRFTLFAPDDDAFDRMEDAARALTHSGDFTALSVLLRQHIVPGYFTPKALSAAIDAAADHAVHLHSLGGTVLTLTKGNGNTITVTSSNGFQAAFDGTAVASHTSAAIGLNGFLGKV